MRLFYVSVIDEDTGRYNLLAGPFTTKAEAEETVEAVRKVSAEIDPRSHWYAFGACSVENYSEPGFLNRHGFMPPKGD